jgi:hypothetical protein
MLINHGFVRGADIDPIKFHIAPEVMLTNQLILGITLPSTVESA